jgi:hypothetical protein
MKPRRKTRIHEFPSQALELGWKAFSPEYDRWREDIWPGILRLERLDLLLDEFLEDPQDSRPERHL